MAQHIIEVRVDEKIASVVGDPLYVCGNSDYVVKFSFDAEWAGHETKTARFIKSNKEYIDVVFAGDQCAVPIIDNTPYVRIGVFAGNLCTTTAAIVNAQRSILCGSGVPVDPDPDVYAQMMARFDELFERDVKTDSEKLGGKPASDYALKSETAPVSHVTDKNNPHDVTYEQVGAAPDGFGLGKNAQAIDSLDNANAFGLYTSNVGVPSIDGKVWWVCLVMPHNTTATMVQMAYRSTGDPVRFAVRRMTNGTWGEWEYPNPPMTPGVEYRTTGRSGVKPVYVKRVQYVSGNGVNPEIGTAGQVTTVNIAHDISGFGELISVSGRVGTYALPVMDSNGYITMVNSVRSTDITLRTNGVWQNERTWIIDLAYTKA